MSRSRVVLLFVLAMLVAAVVAGGAAADGTTITVPQVQPVEATGPDGATVNYPDATATDQDGNQVAVTCAPGSGTPFALGDTQVTCSTADGTNASFTVTVQDRTPPTLALPANITVPVDGATVTYTATATDLVDGAVTPTCTPASGSTFPVGQTTTVNCAATDSHSNTANGSFTVTVKPGAPTFTNVPAPAPVEATGPSGAVVDYATPTATDGNGEPIAAVSCAPASGSTFALATTTVTCTATDQFGTPGTATFSVTVLDRTKPILAAPGPASVDATSASGISASAAPVTAFLQAAQAQDLVDPAPTITNDAPATFPVGTTTVTFTARDHSGNATTKTSTLTVVALPPPTTITTTTTTTTPAPQPPAPAPQPPAPTPPPTPPPAPFKPPVIPPNASGFKAISGRGRITLQWTPPSASAVDHVELLRAQVTVGAQATVIYRGTGRSYVDRKVKDGANYRYQLVSVDSSGNRSAGVAVTAFPLPLRLLAPLSGAKLHTPPTLRWLVTSGASYYNLQVYRNGVKVLSVWPLRAKLQLPRTWKYLGHTYTFASGSYRWYVWAGFGARSAQKYSPLLGQAFFTVP